MEKFDTLIIGFGKAGKTLAGFLSKKGETVAVIDGFAYFIDSRTLTIQPTKASNQNGRGMLTYQQNGSENSITADAVLISVK
ncbi:FAD-dependent monooxygenase [Fundicoccus sp. Sow4_H7]|uniref:FAD-dependent monooxygenase n=1 Tax=Fundicoccus sp. Sow4_H7 TaxID=3438784 RepID=UPI003F923FA2